MTDPISVVVLLLSAASIFLLVVLLRRPAAATDISPILSRLDSLEKLQERSERALKEEVGRLRADSAEHSRALREELQNSFGLSTNQLTGSVDRISRHQQERLESFQKRLDVFSASLERLIAANDKKADDLRLAVENKLTALQTDNSAKLDEMRRTVDEKLQSTLEKRLGESFNLVTKQLAEVHKGLGEMQHLAAGVGDLKRVLTNVKARGTWGEVQLGNLLEQILAPTQFMRNVPVAGTGRAFVEFAIKLPGANDDDSKPVWLPIDAKFPKEDYERLVDAAERGDPFAVEQAGRDLEARVRSQARDIRDKYISPPSTTDFGLLYLPTEGLYAEVLRRPGLTDSIQRDHRVVIVGPTTLAALLNSLQMGFRTLAIQRRSSEVWKVLGAVKTEFTKFGDALDKVKKKINEAGGALDDAAVRTRQMERSLKQVEASSAPSLPEPPDRAGEFSFDPPAPTVGK